MLPSSCCGVVVITLVLHTKGPQFDPGQQQFSKMFLPVLGKFTFYLKLTFIPLIIILPAIVQALCYSIVSNEQICIPFILILSFSLSSLHGMWTCTIY